MILDSLIIEVTRKCNLQCPHCLRGDSQNVSFNTRLIPNLLKGIYHIEDITFSGGEPAMEVGVMRKIFEAIKKHNITIGQFSIITNGFFVSNSFIKLASELMLYQENRDGSTGEPPFVVTLSADNFHEEPPIENMRKLSLYTFTEGWEKIMECVNDDFLWGHLIKSRGRTNDKGVRYWLAEGRAKDYQPTQFTGALFEKRKFIKDEPPKLGYDEDYTYDKGSMKSIMGEIYINAFGEVLDNCNLSYENQALRNLFSLKDTSLVDGLTEIISKL